MFFYLSQKLRSITLKIAKPIINTIGKIHAPFSHKKFKGVDYYTIRDSITPATIFLTTTRGEASNLLNSSDPCHGAIYTSGNTVKYVVEALGKGVTDTDLVTFLMAKDDVVILNPKNVSKTQRIDIARYARTLIGCPYDLEFESGDEEYYCFEVIIAAYQKVLPERKFASSEIWGVKTYRAQDILGDTDNWEIVYDNRK